MSSDDDELAELRAARAARTGGPVAASLTSLREQQRRAQEAEDARATHGSSSFGPPKPQQQRGKDDDDDQDDDDDDLANDPLRQHLPLSFGADKSGREKTAEQASLQSFHQATKRSSFGPPRPPGAKPGGRGGGGITITTTTASVGPPRPPPPQGPGGESMDVGPPRPPADEGDDGGPAVGPPRPPADPGGAGEQEEDAEEDEEEEEEEEDLYDLPISHEVVLGSAHAKAVTCMDIEHTGSRLITGSMDYTIRIYDFHGMKRDMKAFRELEPQEGHPVLAVSWSPTGDQFMVVTGSSQAKLYDRDGHALGEFVRGDMYIRDMKNTKGHVSGLMGGCWHPSDRWTAMTCSEDGTVRIWDTHNVMQKTVVKPTLAKPVRTAVTSCAYGLDGKLIGAGLMDGSIQIWGVSGKFGSSAAVGQVAPPSAQMIEKQNWSYVSRANQLVRDAHTPSNEITSLTFSQDGHTLLSRGMDGTAKIWDLRKFTRPLKAFEELPCTYTSTKIIFSPDEQLVLTGTSSQGPQSEGGTVAFIDKTKLELVRKVGVPSNAIALAWHHRLNQIFVGSGDRKSGSTRAWYDPQRSQRGVLHGASRAPRKPSPFDLTPEQIARAALEAPIERRQRLSGKKRREMMAQDAAKHHKPDPGSTAGAGKQGRIGTSTKTLLTQHLLKQRGGMLAPDLELDPREAILRHEGKQDVFSHFTEAYKETQPKPLYQKEEEDDEGKEDE